MKFKILFDSGLLYEQDFSLTPSKLRKLEASLLEFIEKPAKPWTLLAFDEGNSESYLLIPNGKIQYIKLIK